MTEGRNSITSTGAIALLLTLASGCAMPAASPSLRQVEGAAAAGDVRWVEASSALTLEASGEGASALVVPEAMRAEAAIATDTLGPGDIIDVTILEGGTPTVFVSGGRIGEMAVGADGMVSIPYAGRLRASGRDSAALAAAIESRLRSVVRRPQAQVRLVTPASRMVSVAGAVTKPGSVPLERGRDRLVSFLAQAAPAPEAPQMTMVTLRRDGMEARIPYDLLLARPDLDLALRPGDQVVVAPIDRRVTVLGAAGMQGSVKLDRRGFSVLDALAASRGLDQAEADPRAVFLLRHEESAATAEGDAAPPAIYHFDLRNPAAVALAARAPLRDGDTLLISAAPFAKTRMLLSSVAQTLGTARSAVSIVP